MTPLAGLAYPLDDLAVAKLYVPLDPRVGHGVDVAQEGLEAAGSRFDRVRKRGRSDKASSLAPLLP